MKGAMRLIRIDYLQGAGCGEKKWISSKARHHRLAQKHSLEALRGTAISSGRGWDREYSGSSVRRRIGSGCGSERQTVEDNKMDWSILRALRCEPFRSANKVGMTDL